MHKIAKVRQEPPSVKPAIDPHLLNLQGGSRGPPLYRLLGMENTKIHREVQITMSSVAPPFLARESDGLQRKVVT